MIRYILLFTVFVQFYYTASSQIPEPQSPYTVTNPCEPCEQPAMDIVGSTSGGWPILTLSKLVKYGGCTYRVLYKKRKCDGFEDLKITGIQLEGPCANKPTDQGSKSDGEWMNSMQEMATSIMSELVGTNPMGFSTNSWWHVFTPSCFEFNGVDFISPIDTIGVDSSAMPNTCSKTCCLHVLLVTPDSCDAIRIREVKPFNNDNSDVCSSTPTKTKKENGITCIPVCGRKLTEYKHSLLPNIPRWLR